MKREMTICRYWLGIAAIFLSLPCFANTYNDCMVDDVFTNESIQNMVIVTVSCVAPDAMTTAANCTSGAINPKAFIFDSSTVTGKNHLALVLTAMAGGNRIFAATYGACPPFAPDTLWLYSLKVFRQ